MAGGGQPAADRIGAARIAATARLLAERTAGGHWVGELSSSALSTATAAFALAAADPDAHASLVRDGLGWLAAHQNADGGWGDTAVSGSNLSTTALCWSAFAAGGPGEAYKSAVARAERYLLAEAGSLAPAPLADAVAARYGEDRTFSAPILTMCALANRLGPVETAWRLVPQLPFEVAACPHGMLRLLRLPVVSYALPALIAVGAVRHHHRPTRNPLARAVRRLVTPRVARLLGEIQPPSGGFLEAAPLTSFVLLSLASMPTGSAPWAPVVDRCTAFLRQTVRADGSWPIDTNLATWTTTLSVNALGPDGLPPADRESIRRWLLGQHYTAEHPYTRAAPGGWAWTDLPGGVPDADDTAGALRALRRLGEPDGATLQAARAGCRWLLGLQNADGGVPTFCRGWGRLPFDRSCADLTAHALAAWAAWLAELPAGLRGRTRKAMAAARAYLRGGQRSDGAWLPLWFGNERAEGQANPVFGTARVVSALCEAGGAGAGDLAGALGRAGEFLLAAAGPDRGWGGATGVPPTIEETAAAVASLGALASSGCVERAGLDALRLRRAVADGAAWLVDRTEGGRAFPAAPIGLYFAKLWYHEKLYPILFTVEALRRAAGALAGT